MYFHFISISFDSFRQKSAFNQKSLLICRFVNDAIRHINPLIFDVIDDKPEGESRVGYHV